MTGHYDQALAEMADEIERTAKERTQLVETGGLKRMAVTGTLGVPVWLHELLHDAEWDSPYVEIVELGGRGVKHPTVGWVSIEELRELAGED